MTKYHDANWFWKFDPFRLAAWKCREDGGWGFGLLGVSIARLHRADAIEWRIGPFVKRLGGEISFGKLVFIPAHLRTLTEAQRRYLAERN